MTIKFGRVLLASSLDVQENFAKNAKRHKVKAPYGHLGVFLHLGDVNADTLPAYSADGALLALGYGPQLITKKQQALIEALQAAREYVWHPDEERKDGLLAQIDAALDVQNFIDATKA